ncbi:MAG: hypothetical protein RBR35_13830 [Salinivirgaceae bacterium]|nr:hypothetical protein [Salinivirgaceae bacterium]
MKRHIALEGDRKWFSNHMAELQSEALSAIDKMASYYGPCALSGGEVYAVDTAANKNRFRSGLVVLWVVEKLQWMVMPLSDLQFVSGYNRVRYVVPSKTNIQGEYRMGAGLIAEQYEAVVVDVLPSGSSNGYITIPPSAVRVPDLMQAMDIMNTQRSIFAKHVHQHSLIEETLFNFDNFSPGLCWSYDNGFVINLGNSNLGYFSQLKFSSNGLEVRESKFHLGSYHWLPWVKMSSSKQIIDTEVSSLLISSGYNVRASKHDGYVTLNFYGRIAIDEDIPQSLILLRNVTPITNLTLLQPVIKNEIIVPRELHIRTSGYDTSIRMDTTRLFDYSFSLNITFEHS